MDEVFIKKYWAKENMLFYIHFVDGVSSRQIEKMDGTVIYLSEENPVQGDSKLYDQHINDLDLDKSDIITEKEFNEEWNKGLKSSWWGKIFKKI